MLTKVWNCDNANGHLDKFMHVLLQIHHLAVNALLKSNQVDEIEGGSIFGFDHEMHHGPHVNETDFDEATACAPAFAVLKQLIQRCISDVVASGNVFADAILQHLYRWLCWLNFSLFCIYCLVIASLNYLTMSIFQPTIETP